MAAKINILLFTLAIVCMVSFVVLVAGRGG
jgi:hypothetical protein